MMSFALSITFTKLIVSIDQGSSSLCSRSGAGYSQSSSTAVSQTGTPNKNLEATAGLMSIVLFCISLLNGRIEKMLRRPQGQAWRAALHLSLIAVSLVYIAVAATLAGRSATAVGDYYEAWLLGLLGGYILDALKSLALYYAVKRCLCCELSSSESDTGADDIELGNLALAKKPVVTAQPGSMKTVVNAAARPSFGDEAQTDSDANLDNGYLDLEAAQAGPTGFNASKRTMKSAALQAGDADGARCPKCQAKQVFCMCNDTEARARVVSSNSNGGPSTSVRPPANTVPPRGAAPTPRPINPISMLSGWIPLMIFKRAGSWS